MFQTAYLSLLFSQYLFIICLIIASLTFLCTTPVLMLTNKRLKGNQKTRIKIRLNFLMHSCSVTGGTISVILDISSFYSICSSAAVGIIYTLLGGMLSVAYTDIIQLVFICVGMVS